MKKLQPLYAFLQKAFVMNIILVYICICSLNQLTLAIEQWSQNTGTLVINRGTIDNAY